MNRSHRKQLTQAYKNSMPPMGIFAIKNLANGKMLLDQSTNLPGSWNRHRMELRLGTHRNKALMEDWRVHGEAQFAFEVLESIEERPEPGFDYASELAQRLAAWLAGLPRGSAASYV